MIKYYLTPDAIAAGCKFVPPRTGDAGFDVYATDIHRIIAGTMQSVFTGLHVQLPEGCVGVMKDRSSIGSLGVHIFAGVFDESYRGEYQILMHNEGRACFDINPGDKVAQLLIIPYYALETSMVSALADLDESLRGTGGFGSTGK